MEYSELIHKILTAERNAQEISREAKEQQRSLEDDLEREAAQLRTSYLDQARQRLAQLEQREQAAAQQAIRRLDQRQAAALAAVEAARAEQEDDWVDALLRMIVGGS